MPKNTLPSVAGAPRDSLGVEIYGTEVGAEAGGAGGGAFGGAAGVAGGAGVGAVGVPENPGGGGISPGAGGPDGGGTLDGGSCMLLCSSSTIKLS